MSNIIKYLLDQLRTRDPSPKLIYSAVGIHLGDRAVPYRTDNLDDALILIDKLHPLTSLNLSITEFGWSCLSSTKRSLSIQYNRIPHRAVVASILELEYLRMSNLSVPPVEGMKIRFISDRGGLLLLKPKFKSDVFTVKSWRVAPGVGKYYVRLEEMPHGYFNWELFEVVDSKPIIAIDSDNRPA